jgi:1-acyl-sn-glycerol-3-phosphate acyltransferase
MATRQGALAAGAARASGERARRRSTPLIGAEPVVPAPDAVAPVARETSAGPSARPKTAPKKAASRKAAPPQKPEPKQKHAPKQKPVVKPDPAGKQTAAPEKPEARPQGDQLVDSGTPVADEPTARRPHRPAPKVRSAPSRAASRQSGERRTRSAPVPAAEAPRAPRVRLDPREKARRDAARPHLRIAEPPLDPTVHVAPERTGLPLPDLGDALAAAVGLLRFGAEAAGISPEDIERRVAQVLAYIRRRIEGDYDVDDFGYDADFTENVFYPMLRPIYRRWFRIEVRGIENIPATGGALVVSNHSGTIAIDSLMVQLAIHDEHPQHRVMRALGADLVFQTPFLGTIARRSGSTLATNSDADRLFTQGELVGVFPEGFKGVGKPFSERYKLQRFGRGGFVAAALKAQVPIIPCSVVGAEEIYPIIGNMGTVARLFGLPYAPITPTFPLLGPFGLLPLPSKWVIEFGAPIPTDTQGPGAADDPMLVFDLTDQVRETIQQTLYTLLMQRRSVFF